MIAQGSPMDTLYIYIHIIYIYIRIQTYRQNQIEIALLNQDDLPLTDPSNDIPRSCRAVSICIASDKPSGKRQ